MAFTTELLTVLDDVEEPLAKRLKVANNAFSSLELPVFNKEGILLQWFSKIGSQLESHEIWDTLYSCLTSQHMSEIRQNEIKQEVLTSLIKTIFKLLKGNLDDNLKKSVVRCATVILKTDVFEQYFKHDMKIYCNFVSVILNNISNESELIQLIDGPFLFNKKVTAKTNYQKYFLHKTFNTLVAILMKYEDDNLEKATIKLIQRCLFPNILNDYDIYFDKLFKNEDTSNETLPNLLLNKLIELYQCSIKEAYIAHKIIFRAFVSANKSQNLKIYQFFVVFVHLIGFKINTSYGITLVYTNQVLHVDKSLLILSDLFEALSIENLTLDITLNNVTFNDFIHNIVKSIVNMGRPNLSTLKILKAIIIINPLIADKIISNILSCIMLSRKNEELQKCYCSLLTAIFEMYLKLHRVHKFTSEILRTLKSGLSEDIKIAQPEFEFAGIMNEEDLSPIVTEVCEILPNNLIQYFHHCITLQSSKQVISIMRTLVIKLEDVVNNLQDYSNDTQKITYAQIVTEIICQFLISVRVAEYSMTDLTLNKFCKDMERLKNILAKFGGALLKMKHNQSLMFCFLKICEVWADVAIVVMFYCPQVEEGICLRDMTGTKDNTACNITYLHGYLTTEQWSIVLQRIKNFGEKPCKQIMQKLILQKVRAMVLFEPHINTEVDTQTIRTLQSNIEDNWDILLKENFTAAMIVPKMDTSCIINIAELLVNDFIASNNLEFIKGNCIVNSRSLMTAVLFVWYKNVNSFSKKKRKHNESATSKSLSSAVFQCIVPDDLIQNENLDVILTQISECYINYENIATNVSIDDKQKLCKLLEIPKYLSLCDLPENTQKIFFFYILAVCVDLKKTDLSSNESLICETYLKGLTENHLSPNLASDLSMDVLIKVVLENVDSYREILSFIVNKACRYNETAEACKVGVDMLVKNLDLPKYFELSVIFLHTLNKAKRYKLSEESKKHLKQYKQKLSKHILNKLLSDDHVDSVKVEAYVLALQTYLLKDKDDALMKLTSISEKYINYCMKNMNNSNIEGSLVLYEIHLRHKAKLTIPEDFIIQCWSACKNITKMNDNLTEQLHKTISLIFEHVSNQQFQTIMEDLLNSTVDSLEFERFEEFNSQLKMWKCLLHSALSTVKQNLLLTFLHSLMEHSIIYLINNNNQTFDEIVVKLQVDTIENKKILPTGNIMDIYLQTVGIIMSREYDYKQFPSSFAMCISIMEALIRTRKFLIVDRLPAFLAQLRILIKKLCMNSNSDMNLDHIDNKNISDCAFKVEKLTRNVCQLKRDMARIAPYLIGDIVKQYEKITFLPEVKNHLNNCLYYLIELCDYHAISYLMRGLSSSSTELFKRLYDSFNRYHKFTGKV